VNCGPRSYFNHIAITCLLSRTVYFTRILLLFSTRYTHNLCFKQTGEIDNLIVSWEQSICLCVCRFHVAASMQSLDEAPYINCPQLSQTSKHHLQSFVSPLQERLNLDFIIEGKLAAILITPSSWGSQRAGQVPRTRKLLVSSTTHQANFLASLSTTYSHVILAPAALCTYSTSQLSQPSDRQQLQPYTSKT
jgi:hypothetical protein